MATCFATLATEKILVPRDMDLEVEPDVSVWMMEKDTL